MSRSSGVNAPCWFELLSSDHQASGDFLAAVFGWRCRDAGSVEGALLENTNGLVGVLHEMPAAAIASGAHSHWTVSFAVEDCDRATAQALELGGALLEAPTDRGTLGRKSLMRDPTGAAFGLWQARSANSGLVMFENNSVNWVELATRDASVARNFYAALFGWAYVESPIPVEGAGNYTEISSGEQRVGGVIPMNEEWGDIAPHWAIYVRVTDIESCIERVKRYGGTNTLPPFEAPGVGWIAMIADPTGATNYIIRMSDGT